jgi:NADH:ubiquinone oxidoreductase subunit H
MTAVTMRPTTETTLLVARVVVVVVVVILVAYYCSRAPWDRVIGVNRYAQIDFRKRSGSDEVSPGGVLALIYYYGS